MTPKNEAAEGKNPYMAGCVFLGILAIIFALNVFIRFPFQSPVSIGKNGASCLESPGKHWFVLEEGSYIVSGQFETISVRSSGIPFLSKRYTYYIIEVTSDEETFIMPVRVNAKKSDSLERGKAVALYGMVSELDADLFEKQYQALNGRDADATPMCLNDNGDTVVTRIFSAVVFALLTVACIWLAVKIYSVKV